MYDPADTRACRGHAGRARLGRRDLLVGPRRGAPYAGDLAKVDVWRVCFGAAGEHLAKLASVLCTEEAARASRFHFEKDRRSFVIARGVMRLLLARYFDVSPSDIVLRYNAYGKPFLETRARDPMFFNLSHSGDLAVLAFCRGVPVGVDVEQVRGDRAMPEIAMRYFSEAENLALSRLGEDERSIGFFRCWTRKEAYIKGLGRGLSIPLDSFDVSVDRSAAPILLAARHETEVGAAGAWSIHVAEVGARYAGAVAVNAPKARLSYFEY
jgi:4'-phosphopantetheinyl transferase